MDDNLTVVRRTLCTLIQLVWPARCPGCDVLMTPRLGADITGPADIFCAECHPTIDTVDEPCMRCAMPLQNGTCTNCAREPLPLVSAASAVAYGGAMKQAILRLKHGARRDLGATLGPAFAGALALAVENVPSPNGHVPIIAVPVPLHPNRLRHRGYNQALELLRHAAPAQGIPILPDALIRRVDTLPLANLSPTERRDRVRDVFEIRRGCNVAGRHVILADDVMTTGATLVACARRLLAAGASGVSAAVLARAI